MLNFGRTARLILVATVPALAMAQTAPVHPAPQQRPAASSTAGTPTAPTARPQAPAAPSSQRFVTTENFFHARPKGQPSSNPSPSDAASLAAQPTATRNTPVPQPRPMMPAAVQPATTAAIPALSSPQPPAAMPVLITPSAAGSGHEGSAAVDYSQGQLTVVSQSAPLGLVLKLVAAKTGAVIDLAPELQNEPVIAQLGPGPGREVLTGLLDSPRIDYIIMETGDETGKLQRIVVRTRQAFARVAMAAIHQPQPKQEDADEETNLDANGHLASGVTPAEAKLTQQQLMENWKKIREEKRLAEIQQQEQDRENEKTQVEPTPQPQPEPPPDNPPQL
jgi:hypothetical protein